MTKNQIIGKFALMGIIFILMIGAELQTFSNPLVAIFATYGISASVFGWSTGKEIAKVIALGNDKGIAYYGVSIIMAALVGTFVAPFKAYEAIKELKKK